MHPTIEPELQYCPRCNDEYRSDIRTCAACEVALISGAELLARRVTRRQNNSPVPTLQANEPLRAVTKGPVTQIKALQACLEQQGLPSRAVKEEGGGCGCRGAELVLQVRECDLPEVLEIMEQEYRRSTGLTEHDTRFSDAVYDPGADEAVCPACGHRFSTALTACPDCGLCFV
jgi:hypothetical protein